MWKGSCRTQVSPASTLGEVISFLHLFHEKNSPQVGGQADTAQNEPPGRRAGQRTACRALEGVRRAEFKVGS